MVIIIIKSFYNEVEFFITNNKYWYCELLHHVCMYLLLGILQTRSIMKYNMRTFLRALSFIRNDERPNNNHSYILQSVSEVYNLLDSKVDVCYGQLVVL